MAATHLSSPESVAAFLSRYNKWRRGQGEFEDGAVAMPEPAEIGKAIDAAVGMLAELKAAREQEPVAWMYDWQATEGLIRDWCTANLAEVSGPVINIRPLYSRPVLHAEQPVNARLLEALKHILNSSLLLPRFAEEQARAAIAAAETRQAEPAGSLTLDKGEVEFLAARVRRLLAKFGVHEPEKDSRFIVGVAGSLIGNLLTNIELKEKAGMVRLSGDDQPAPVIIEGAPCRNALARDGKPYPKSSCQRCGTLLRSGWKCANGVEI